VLSPAGVQVHPNSAGMFPFESACHLYGGVYCQVNRTTDEHAKEHINTNG
jgi:hypothetical protein